MSLLDKLMENQNRLNPPETETKTERLQIVIEGLIENLPFPAQVLARNYINSCLQFNEDHADKICEVLDELKNYIQEGTVPDGAEVAG